MARGTISNLVLDSKDKLSKRQGIYAETVDLYSADVATKTDPQKRSELGQFMTPIPIARFMANLFSDVSGDLRILDPGAGVGSLTAALAEFLCNYMPGPDSVSFTAYEIDPLLLMYLQDTLNSVKLQCKAAQFQSEAEILNEDFILASSNVLEPDNLFDKKHDTGGFTHVIMNPPYKKINSASQHRLTLRKAGIEVTNLYAAFMALASRQLCEGGELVAIVPRSFCNGPYFKAFRKHFFSSMSLHQIHLFEKRDCAFKIDGVLQENIILHAIKGKKPSQVKITTSSGSHFEEERSTRKIIGENMTQFSVDHNSLICPDDTDCFLHIITNEMEQVIAEQMTHFETPLEGLGLSVSTGPVVDFRLKDDLRDDAASGTAPLLYPAHFRNRKLQWPICMKKPNAIQVTKSSRKWLWDNEGHFVVTRRFTAKEERRRIVASVYASEIPGKLVGFENHLNVYHVSQKGMSPHLAKGLGIFLNSTLVDRYFRQFNGHTQVNVTDLRSLKYPKKETLERWGEHAYGIVLSQQVIDDFILGEISHMATSINPFMVQKKIEETLEVLKHLGLPKGQINRRSALTLLALIDLKPEETWRDVQSPSMGITQIMDWIRDHYGEDYAANSRETFRRQTMHQFVDAGLVVLNPDDPGRPINSPHTCYKINLETCEVLSMYGEKGWGKVVEAFLNERGPLYRNGHMNAK
ncbi:MAG: Eco57I restriction-modification methylase domain-containing protein [Rhodobacteraceae bacterium]|nr:Eco57I restriction-modification methylase domain-containing protein [Paracoccaceae bacterium]